jgi:DtxR family Mn-dependent transcriptional regulator
MTQDDEQLSASLEDYLETIAHIVEEKKVARAKEIAANLNVSRSSVTEALRSLAKKGLIHDAPYEVITMTAQGEIVSADIILRHKALQDFFIKVLAVDPQIADEGACKVEHAAPREIIDRMINFVKFIEECPRGGSDWIQSFKEYCASGKTRDNCETCIANCLDK